MNNFGLAIYSCEQLKAIDNSVIQTGVSGYQLMTRAGLAAFQWLKELWPDLKSIAVLCGNGNNGGDGFVLARLAKIEGFEVTVYVLTDFDEEKLPQEARQAYQDCLEHLTTQTFEEADLRQDVVVDALLGIGARGPLSAPLQKAIKAINESRKPILSIDIPSGLLADEGSSLEQAVRATHTITFIGMKLGLIVGEGIELAGEIHFDSLGIDTKRYSAIPTLGNCLNYESEIKHFPVRRLNTHKGEQGHVGIIGAGQMGFSGAACLAAESALRAGAGLVSAIVSPESLPLMARAPMEVMCHGLLRPRHLNGLLEKLTVIVLGPGLTQNSWGKKFFAAALAAKKPMVVDADGLNLLALNPEKNNHWILTPHPGEAARLLETSVTSIQTNRLACAKAIQAKFGGVVVLKGAGTIIISEGGQCAIQPGGLPILATGGTGDVLAGLIGGLMAQGLSFFDAAKLGVSVHANAAKLEESMGVRGMIASDLFLHIRNLLNL